jgi:AraC-like DNA-binding protein
MWSAANFRISPAGIPTYELADKPPAKVAGLSSWEINYDQGYSNSPGGLRFDISFVHRHPHFEIFWIRRGHGTIAWDCEQVEVGPRTLLVVAPGEVHAWIQTQELEGSALAVSETFTASSNFFLPFSQLTSLLGPKVSRKLTLSPADEALVGSFFANLQAEGTPAHFDRREMAKALLLLLLGRIQGRQTLLAPERRAAVESPLAREFQRALLTECPRLATVKEFAQLLKVSRSHLHEEVLHATGRRPSELIRERIIVEAKRLLVHTRCQPAEIARTLGFKNTTDFKAYFRLHARQSPAEYQARRSA